MRLEQVQRQHLVAGQLVAHVDARQGLLHVRGEAVVVPDHLHLGDRTVLRGCRGSALGSALRHHTGRTRGSRDGSGCGSGSGCRLAGALHDALGPLLLGLLLHLLLPGPHLGEPLGHARAEEQQPAQGQQEDEAQGQQTAEKIVAPGGQESAATASQAAAKRRVRTEESGRPGQDQGQDERAGEHHGRRLEQRVLPLAQQQTGGSRSQDDDQRETTQAETVADQETAEPETQLAGSVVDRRGGRQAVGRGEKTLVRLPGEEVGYAGEEGIDGQDGQDQPGQPHGCLPLPVIPTAPDSQFRQFRHFAYFFFFQFFLFFLTTAWPTFIPMPGRAKFASPEILDREMSEGTWIR